VVVGVCLVSAGLLCLGGALLAFQAGVDDWARGYAAAGVVLVGVGCVLTTAAAVTPNPATVEGAAVRRASWQLDAAHAVVRGCRHRMANVLAPTRASDAEVDQARVELAAAVEASAAAHGVFSAAVAAYHARVAGRMLRVADPLVPWCCSPSCRRQAGACAWVAAVEAWVGALTGDSFSLGAGVVCCGLATTCCGGGGDVSRETRVAVVERSGAVFVPDRIRAIPDERRRVMFGGPPTAAFERWAAREWALCARPGLDGLRFFVEGYGSVEPPVGGPVAFRLWERQVDVLADLHDQDLSLLVVLKARRLGLTWLALHYAVWLAVFAPLGTGARIVIICKNEDDAKALLQRARRIIERLPAYLRPILSKDSTEELGIHETGASIRALPGTPQAARLETATLLLLDEFAFPKNGAATGIWTAALPTIEGGGRAVAISTGNGESGDGAQFAALVRLTQRRQLARAKLVFLDVWSRPGRTPEWYRQEMRKYLRLEDFQAEYPETVDQGLAGSRSASVYPLSGLVAAESWVPCSTPTSRPCCGRASSWAPTGATSRRSRRTRCRWPAVGCGWSTSWCRCVPPPPRRRGRCCCTARRASTPACSEPRRTPCRWAANRVFANVLQELAVEQPGAFPDQHTTWSFGTVKEGGGDRKGTNTVAYVEWLLVEAAALWEQLQHAPPEAAAQLATQARGYLAISPRCATLLHQMREYRRDPDTGRIIKGVLSATDPLAGDHGPDALVALLAERAAAWRPRWGRRRRRPGGTDHHRDTERHRGGQRGRPGGVPHAGDHRRGRHPGAGGAAAGAGVRAGRPGLAGHRHAAPAGRTRLGGPGVEHHAPHPRRRRAVAHVAAA
jgi:hypothetical protein